MSKLFVDEIVHQSSQGSGTITLGASGETINIPSGSTINLSNSTVTLNSTMKNTPNFLAYRATSTQSLTQNATTNVIMNAEAFDTDSAYDTSTGKFTCPVGKAGKYFFTAGFSLNTASSAVHSGFQIRNSGGTGQGSPYTKPDPFINYQGSTAGSVMSIVCDMEEGFTINPVAYVTSAGITLGTNRSYFGGYKLIG